MNGYSFPVYNMSRLIQNYIFNTPCDVRREFYLITYGIVCLQEILAVLNSPEDMQTDNVVEPVVQDNTNDIEVKNLSDNSNNDTVSRVEFERVLQQAIKRKGIIADLEAKLSDMPEVSPAVQESVSPAVNPDDLVETVFNRIQAMQKEQAQAQQNIDSIVSEYGIPDSMRSLVANSQDPKATAGLLAKEFKSYAATTGNAGGAIDTESLIEQLNKSLGI